MFVYASVVDANGTVVPDASTAVSFSVQGAELIGDNPVKAEAGIATILVRAGLQPALIQVTATAANLSSNALTINSK